MNGVQCIGTLDVFDVGLSIIIRDGRRYPIWEAIGYVQGKDIGKRVFWDGEIVTVENDEQRDARLAKEANREE